jgi:hypothetical protein
MISIAANSNNDIFATGLGSIGLVYDAEAVAQNCKTAMQAQRGEMVYRINDGMPMRETAFDGFNAAQFEAAGRAVLLAVEGVQSVESFTVTRIDDRVVYSAVIATIYGAQAVSNEL